MPQRFLRPGITNSERWNSIPFDAQSLYIRLLTIVDDFGRCDGRSAVVAAHTFAVWNELNQSDRRNLQQVERILQQLEKAELIERYSVEGKRVLQIVQWQERVRQGVKERWPCRNPQQDNGELLPSSPLTLANSPASRDRNHLQPAATPSNLQQHGIAWNKKDGFSGISEKDRKEWAIAYPACDLDRQLAAMHQWLLANPVRAKKSNWRKFVTNWLSRQQDRGGDRRNGTSSAAHRKIERSKGEYPSNVDRSKVIK